MSTTTTAAATTKLLCPECRRENESERIYCHDCGTRLDRTAVRVKKEPIQDTHKRVKQMFDPQRAKMRALLIAGTKMILGAGLLALVLDMVLPPQVPPPIKSQMLISGLRFDLDNMSKKHIPATKQISEDDANGYALSALKPKQAALDKPLLEFKRALIAFHEGRLSFTVERSVSGYWPVYTRLNIAPELKDGHLLGKIEGGYIGRLPIHPKLAKHMSVLFGDVAAVLDNDVKVISKLGAVELHEKSVTLNALAP